MPLPLKRRILVVEDDASILEFVARVLARDYEVFTAGDGTDAMAVASTVGHLDLLVTDYLMPSMTGEELAGRLRAERPTLKVLFLTAYAGTLVKEQPAIWATEAYVEKPVAIDTLRAAVSSLISDIV